MQLLNGFHFNNIHGDIISAHRPAGRESVAETSTADALSLPTDAPAMERAPCCHAVE